jgi:HK97 family phage portal protein
MVVTEANMLVPARDVIHFRQYTPRHPLVGESPIKAAALAVGINVALSQTQAAFFSRMNRPSGILSTDQTLTKEQMVRLREAFEEQSKVWAKGGMPILGNGMSFTPLSVTSQDAQLIQAQRLSIEEIARVFGVPLPIIGDLSNATMSNVEHLINMWLSMSLGALFENIERSFDRAFALGANEYVQFEEAALLRTDFAGRIEGLTKAISGGLMSPNEARVREGLKPVDDGDMPMMQQQMMPLDVISDFHKATLEAKLNPPTPLAPPSSDVGSKSDAPKEDASFDGEVASALVSKMFQKKAA